MKEPAARIVDWFRRDTSRAARSPMFFAFGCLTVNAVSLIVAERLTASLQGFAPGVSASVTLPPESVVGHTAVATNPLVIALLLLSGLSMLAAGIYLRRGVKVLDQSDYLLLRTDGLERRSGNGSWFVPWEDVMDAHPTDAGAVAIEMRSGEQRTLVGAFGISAAALSSRISEVRRKALFGLLR